MKNKKALLTSLLLVFISAFTFAQKNLAERLGYPADSRLLIIHGDDLAVAHSENQASFAALEKGMVTSASIMAPCPWMGEVAEYARNHPDHDLGMHLVLTSEWKNYKWGPVASSSEVPGLVNANGYFYDNCNDAGKATPAEVERELRAQIELARRMGIEPTHLDSHMGCLFFQNPAFFEIFLKLGREYKIPTMVSRDFLSFVPKATSQLLTDKDIVIDHVFSASPGDFKGGMAAYYSKVLESLEPGVNIMIIHLAYDNSEMQGISVDHPDWGAAWRQADFNFFTSEECRKLLKEKDIKLITWREVGKLLK